MSEEFESSVNAEPAQNVDVQSEEVQSQSSESVVEEVATSQTEKQVQSQEENSKYAAIRREAEAKAQAKERDKTISDLYGESHGIHTWSDYQKAVEQAAEEKRKTELQEQGIDPNVVDQYVNNNPVVKKAAELIKQQEEQQRKVEEYGEFLDYYKQENNRSFNPETEQIPEEVWLMTAEKNPDGTPNRKRKTLADAYAYHANKQLKAKLAEYEAKLKAQETNASNAASSPGSVTGNGEIKGDFVSLESFEANKNDQNWVNKNFNKIMSSRANW